jgi:hypothetical protein
MPKTKTTTAKKPRQTKQLTCASCGKLKNESEYFVSYHAIHNATGRLPYCKQCLDSMIQDVNKNIDIEKLKNTLKLINRPFLFDIWELSITENPNSPFGTYMKNLGLKQNRSLTWQHSQFTSNDDGVHESFESIDDDLITFWGKNWQPDEYIRLQNFYQSMVDMNHPETPQDHDYLKKITRLSIQIDKAIEEGNSSAAKSLGDLYSKYMADAKLRTTDTTDADKSGGIRRFGDIYAEVEKDGFIPPWEHYRKINGAKQDIVDKTIMFILNFMLKFNKSDKLSHPPADTPKIEPDEIDEKAQSSIELEDLEVDDYE